MQLEPVDSRVLSDRLLHAARGHRQALHTLALLLVELVDGHHHRALGYASLGEYAAKVLDLPPRQVKDLLRIGRALPGLPQVAAAMQAGALDWTKVRELVRVATPETEAEWVTRAGERTSRVLEQEVARSLRGELPPETGEPERAPARGGVLFHMEAVERAVVLDGIAVVRARTGVSAAEVEDGAILAAIVRFVIAHAGATMTPIEVSVARPGASTVSTGEVSPEQDAATRAEESGASMDELSPQQDAPTPGRGGGRLDGRALAAARWRHPRQGSAHGRALPDCVGPLSRLRRRHLAWRGGERHDRGGGCL
jgi:hypothetical protein